MTRLDRPILMLGPPRSGKSMVADRLGELPEFALALEPVTTWRIGAQQHEHDQRLPAEATDDVCQRIRGSVAEFLRIQGAERYVDDLPHHALHVEFCAKVLPEARFILVLRDARETLAEMLCGWRFRDTIGQIVGRRLRGDPRKALKLRRLPRQGWRWLTNVVRQRVLGRSKKWWGPTVPGQFEFARDHSLAEMVAFQWSQIMGYMRDGVALLPEDQVLEIRYEELLADVAAVTSRIADFCQVERPQRLVELAVRNIELARPAYAAALTAEEFEVMAPIIRRQQEEIGYPCRLEG